MRREQDVSRPFGTKAQWDGTQLKPCLDVLALYKAEQYLKQAQRWMFMSAGSLLKLAARLLGLWDALMNSRGL